MFFPRRRTCRSRCRRKGPDGAILRRLRHKRCSDLTERLLWRRSTASAAGRKLASMCGHSRPTSKRRHLPVQCRTHWAGSELRRRREFVRRETGQSCASAAPEKYFRRPARRSGQKGRKSHRREPDERLRGIGTMWGLQQQRQTLRINHQKASSIFGCGLRLQLFFATNEGRVCKLFS